jgi:hypothetical protein
LRRYFFFATRRFPGLRGPFEGRALPAGFFRVAAISGLLDDRAKSARIAGVRRSESERKEFRRKSQCAQGWRTCFLNSYAVRGDAGGSLPGLDCPFGGRAEHAVLSEIDRK